MSATVGTVSGDRWNRLRFVQVMLLESVESEYRPPSIASAEGAAVCSLLCIGVALVCVARWPCVLVKPLSVVVVYELLPLSSSSSVFVLLLVSLDAEGGAERSQGLVTMPDINIRIRGSGPSALAGVWRPRAVACAFHRPPPCCAWTPLLWL